MSTILPIKQIIKTLLIILIIISPSITKSGEILRFEHFNTQRGLSQNGVSCILSDSKGFLWIGTNNGLNRYDGNKFRIFLNEQDGKRNFTHNRITRLWEDVKGFIWFETHDGYYHYFNPVTEQFHSLATTLPESEEKHFLFSDFLQYSENEIWIGLAEKGVLRLKYSEQTNNYIITSFSSRGVNTISNDKVSFVRKDEHGNIWIGTHKGITLIDKEAIELTTPKFQHLFITHAFTDFMETSSELWFATSDAGILQSQKQGQQYTYINKQNTPSLMSNNVTKLRRTESNAVLATFRNSGIQVLVNAGEEWKTVQVNGKQVDQIYEDRFGLVWITTENFGLTAINQNNWSSKFFNFFKPNEAIVPDLERHIFYEDQKNNFWVGTHEGGLNLFDRQKESFVQYKNNPANPNSLSSNIVMAITEDHSGQLWVGTGQFQGSLERVVLKEPAFDHLLPDQQIDHISDNMVRALFEDPEKRLWIGTKAGRLHVYKDRKELAVYNNFNTNNGVLTGVNPYALMIDNKGYLWIGSKGKGILVTREPLKNYANIKNISFVNYQYNTADSTSLGNNNVYALICDNYGQIWVGTYGNGLSRVIEKADGTRIFERINTQNSNLSSNMVRNLMMDSKNRLWVATGYGLNLIENANTKIKQLKIRNFFSTQNTREGISLNDVIHLFEDSNNEIWIATFGGGINKLKELSAHHNQFESYNQLNGLSHNMVYGILEDNEGMLWFSSENGLSRFNKKHGSFEVYNSNNGLNFNAFSENTCLKSADGRLLFGGFLGIEIITPEKLQTNPWQKSVQLTGFQLFNKDVAIEPSSPLQKSISFTDKITLRYDQSSFSFEFSALDFLDPEKTQYSYKLEHFDPDWNVVGNQRKATYTNLAPGDYVFRVKATNRAGQWITDERTVYITILPPWYKTIWAFIGYSAILVALFFVVYRTISEINHYRNELKIERRVNEMKLRFFTNISHEIRTPLTLIIGPIEDLIKKSTLEKADKQKLEIIKRNGKRMLHLTNQLLDFRKIQNNRMILKVSEFDIVGFTRNIFESFAPLAQHKNIDYQFHSANSSFFIWGDPSKLDMVIYNLLSNALKFTDAEKSIRINIEPSGTGKSIEIKVTDQGRGIPKAHLPELFERYTILSGKELAGTGIGLSLANELVKLHDGEIDVDSEPGRGSTFTVRLKTGKEHFEHSDKIVWATPGATETAPTLSETGANDESEFTPEQEETHESGKPLVMVVEDNHEIREYIRQSLSPEFICCSAENGQDALNMLHIQSPDLIISDIMMPVMDGLEMTAKIKDNFQTSHIPVILLTSKSDINDQITGIETGAEAYITKPFNSSYLKAMAQNLMEQRRNIISKFRDNKTIDPATLKVSSKDEEFLKQLVTFIEDNHSEEFSIETLAEKMCVSRTVFYNKVKGLTGLSPVEFVRQLKLKIAARFIENGYNVSEAAIKVGFSDARYFSRQFKALFGYLPSKHSKLES